MKPLRKFFLFFSPILQFIVQEESMLPVFKPGDHILVNRMSYLFKNPKVEDIVVIQSPEDGNYLLKYIQRIDTSSRQTITYFVVGKNKESRDSRQFGWIDRDNIIGKVLL